MKRPWLILIGGLLLAVVAYGACYLSGSARLRNLQTSSAPELAWLQKEFKLSDAEFARVEQLHQSYLAGCAERCRIIDAKNAALRELLASTNTVTPEIERAIQESAQLRAACQSAMLQHFYAISQMMPPDQGKRYFDWVVGCTFGSEHESMTAAPAVAPHEHHHE